MPIKGAAQLKPSIFIGFQKTKKWNLKKYVSLVTGTNGLKNKKWPKSHHKLEHIITQFYSPLMKAPTSTNFLLMVRGGTIGTQTPATMSMEP